eukprot:gene25725-biopygen12019
MPYKQRYRTSTTTVKIPFRGRTKSSHHIIAPPPRRVPPLSSRRLAGPRARTPSRAWWGRRGPPRAAASPHSTTPSRGVSFALASPVPLSSPRRRGAAPQGRWMGGWVSAWGGGTGNFRDFPGRIPAHKSAPRAARPPPRGARSGARTGGWDGMLVQLFNGGLGTPLPWLCLPFPRGNYHAATPPEAEFWGGGAGQKWCFRQDRAQIFPSTPGSPPWTPPRTPLCSPF